MIKERFFTKNTEFNFVILLPIINALATLLTGFFSKESFLNPGELRAILIMVFSIFFYLKRFPRFSSASKLLLFFLIYTFILCSFTSDPAQSLKIYLKLFVSTSLFVIGYYYAKYDIFLKKITITILISLLIFIINFIISNYFKIGLSSYRGVENELYFGGGGVNLAKLISAIVLMAPVFYFHIETKKGKMIAQFLIFLGILFILFAFKRSAIIGLTIGYFTYFISSNNLKKNTKQLVVFAFILLISYPIYYDQVKDNFNAREKAIRIDDQENLEKQGRYLETLNVIDAFNNGSIKHKLFGSEFFNDREFFNTRRMLHTDYTNIVNGTGIIGTILFFLTYFFIYKELKTNKNILKTKEATLYYSVGFALLVGLLFYGIAGTIMGIEPRGTILFLLGAITGRSSYRVLKTKDLHR